MDGDGDLTQADQAQGTIEGAAAEGGRPFSYADQQLTRAPPPPYVTRLTWPARPVRTRV
jgi:hypothetical protein